MWYCIRGAICVVYNTVWNLQLQLIQQHCVVIPETVHSILHQRNKESGACSLVPATDSASTEGFPSYCANLQAAILQHHPELLTHVLGMQDENCIKMLEGRLLGSKHSPTYPLRHTQALAGRQMSQAQRLCDRWNNCKRHHMLHLQAGKCYLRGCSVFICVYLPIYHSDLISP